MGKILLFYKYVDIENPQAIVNWQRELCTALGLKGRILIATEGINATVGGSEEATEEYKKQLLAHPLFYDVDVKESPGGAECFPKLKVLIKNEIVKLGLDTKEVTAKDAGKYLEPKQAHEFIKNRTKDVVLLDTRNDYESKVGTFTDSIIPNTRTFREFPQYVNENLEEFKDKEVLMFCTGGIRCERASAYLKSKNIAKEVYHIKGGIHRYAEEFPDGFFRGKNYVFDARITTRVTNDILANCEHCKIPYDEYTNCINASCNRQIIVCPSCIDIYHNTCSTDCQTLVEEKKVNIRAVPYKIDQGLNK